MLDARGSEGLAEELRHGLEGAVHEGRGELFGTDFEQERLRHGRRP
jgi:hypothetical protein